MYFSDKSKKQCRNMKFRERITTFTIRFCRVKKPIETT